MKFLRRPDLNTEIRINIVLVAIHLSRDIFIRQKCNLFRITFENRTSLKSLNL
jgi:hypothetical protein